MPQPEDILLPPVASEQGAESPDQDAPLSAQDAWKSLSPENRRIIKICAILGIITVFVLPIVTAGLAIWKYNQERAMDRSL